MDTSEGAERSTLPLGIVAYYYMALAAFQHAKYLYAHVFTHVLGLQAAGNLRAVLGAEAVRQLALVRLASGGQIDGRLGDRRGRCNGQIGFWFSCSGHHCVSGFSDGIISVARGAVHPSCPHTQVI